MFKRSKGGAARQDWGWAKISPAIVAALGGLLFWRRRKRSGQPPS